MQITKKQKALYYLLNILIPIFVGTIVYVFFRPDTYISQTIYDVLNVKNLPPFISSILPAQILSFVRNFLSDILWAYALTHTVALILHNERISAVPIFIICSAFEILIELFQKINIINGTFDPLDIAFEISITAFATLLINNIFKEKTHEKHH